MDNSVGTPPCNEQVWVHHWRKILNGTTYNKEKWFIQSRVNELDPKPSMTVQSCKGPKLLTKWFNMVYCSIHIWFELLAQKYTLHGQYFSLYSVYALLEYNTFFLYNGVKEKTSLNNKGKDFQSYDITIKTSTPTAYSVSLWKCPRPCPCLSYVILKCRLHPGRSESHCHFLFHRPLKINLDRSPGERAKSMTQLRRTVNGGTNKPTHHINLTTALNASQHVKTTTTLCPILHDNKHDS